MVKVKATNAYKKNNLKNGNETLVIEDSELGRVPEEGEIFEVSEERFNKLNGNNAYGLVFVEKIEEEVKKPTKKKTNKKKIS